MGLKDKLFPLQDHYGGDQGLGPSKALRRRARRREMSPGFPVLAPFESIEDVDVYLSGAKIQCLLCGKMFRSLGVHLSLHSISADEYRVRYGIPYTRSLCCSETSGLHSANIGERVAADPDEFEKYVTKARAVPRVYRPPVSTVLKQRMERITGLKTGGWIDKSSKCVFCGLELPGIRRLAAQVCGPCMQSHPVYGPPPPSISNPQRRRERSMKHYYKDLEKTRRLLRERAVVLRGRKKTTAAEFNAQEKR